MATRTTAKRTGLASADLSAKALLAALLGVQLDTVPPGWFTSQEWCARWRLSQSRTYSVVTELTRGGKMERAVYLIQTPTGPRRVPHYRVRS